MAGLYNIERKYLAALNEVLDGCGISFTIIKPKTNMTMQVVVEDDDVPEMSKLMEPFRGAPDFRTY